MLPSVIGGLGGCFDGVFPEPAEIGIVPTNDRGNRLRLDHIAAVVRIRRHPADNEGALYFGVRIWRRSFD
jgi:hypothetical protein